MMRVLVILAMVWQPLLLAAAGPRMGISEPVSGSSCSVPALLSNCCDAAPKAPTCHSIASGCGCEIRPAEQPQRAPEAPLPRPDRDTLVAIQICGPPVREQIETDATSILFATQSDSRYANKTHNEIRAILGIWRT